MGSDKNIEGKFKQFNRVLMSYIDFQQACAIASIIIEENLHSNYPRENRVKLEALNSSMVIAYCRPFSGNKGIPDLPRKFINHLTIEELETHKLLMGDRNKMIAHSDGEAWNMRPYYQRVNGLNILVPLHYGVHRPFLKGDTENICALAEKQQEACFEVRERLENELKPYIPIVEEN